ncbi:MAG: transcription-repair coupling factor [Planctomycetes bacterium]|nr:transcription-repair coupling factor [Planctomycetota bacterium]
MVIPQIAEDIKLTALARQISDHGGVVSVSGLWGSSAPMVAAELSDRCSEVLLYVAAHLVDAEQAREDLEFFNGSERDVDLFSAWETLPGEGPAAGEIHAERRRMCLALEAGQVERPRIIAASIQALLQPVPSAKTLAAHTLALKVGEQFDLDFLTAWFLDHGFARLDLLEAPGDFARRGDILDVFATDRPRPIRVEFFGDTVESIRVFDVSTQRSIERLEDVSICAAGHVSGRSDPAAASFLDFLPKSTIVFLDGPSEIQEMGNIYRERTGGQQTLYETEAMLADLGEYRSVHSSRFGGAPLGSEQGIHFPVRSLSRFEGRSAEAIGELLDLASNRDVHVVCENEGERSRLLELLEDAGTRKSHRVEASIGFIHRGFDWVDASTVVVGHHEVFHRSRPRRRIRKTTPSHPLDGWMELEPGDLVVHNTHGIARFRKMEVMRRGSSEKTEEYLTLEFDDKAVLHVPASQIDLVQKYVGAGAHKPTLSKLGGTRWNKSKERAGEATAELAEAMLRTQAAREANEGIAYPADTAWQREFEDAFPYDETDDQIVVAAEIAKDLQRSQPMDRLICGDVGYGKTELSMRAAFKVVEFGKQVAVLVPTTVLAEQHFRTFSERMADYPFAIGCLSRFRTTKQQKQLIEEAKKGRVDIVIGTHRLLSKDVSFSDLGLLIVDEEQRFGVEHKERLKTLRTTIEVLTLSATPIPRTLHMSMMGIRDISSLATPPVDRRSIATEVCHYDEGLIRQGIIREMNRDGQVYFIHNLVHDIEEVADDIRRIVPECRVLVGHGQMKDRELEDVMRRFINQEADVLVATTIIESGIDLPTVNTIFIDIADRYGLSDLHQLRGRVGRGSHRAYCYLLLPKKRPLTPKAARRLKSIEEFSELGAGFRIAMRDLEIRGAGNILGPQQSGHIAAVGYEMYCKLMERAVRRLRDQPARELSPVHIELGVSAFIPRSYIPNARARIEIYRRVVACESQKDLEQLAADLADAFGSCPEPVSMLLDLAEVRVLARSWRIRSIVADDPDLIFTVRDLAHAQAAFAKAPGTVRMPDPTTVYLRLRSSYFEGPTLLACLRKLLGQPTAIKETVK